MYFAVPRDVLPVLDRNWESCTHVRLALTLRTLLIHNSDVQIQAVMNNTGNTAFLSPSNGANVLLSVLSANENLRCS
jgi:hypothetical protein